jgi:hypothetical protein
MKLASITDSCILELQKIHFQAGSITPIEGLKNIPFEIARVFYIYDIPGGVSRGAHAHKECEQILIAASGSFDILLDDGINKKYLSLNRPYYGLYIPHGIWSSQLNFSSGAICLVLTSHRFEESDYIREYSHFLAFRNGNH